MNLLAATADPNKMVPFTAKLAGFSVRRALFLFGMFVSTVRTFRFTGCMATASVTVQSWFGLSGAVSSLVHPAGVAVS